MALNDALNGALNDALNGALNGAVHGVSTGLLALALGAGFALGCAYFGSLWWSVRRALATGPASLAQALQHLLALLLRVGLALLGFYLAGGGDWQRLLACLAGFIAARVVVTRLTARHVAAPADGGRRCA